MESGKKLKTDFSATGLIPAAIALLISGITLAAFGPDKALNVLGTIFIIYATLIAVTIFKTKNKYYYVSFFYLFCAGLYLLFAQYDYIERRIVTEQEGKIILVFTILFLVWLIYLLITKKLKWRGRDIFELAGYDIMVGDATYTDRPRPIKRLDYSQNEIYRFAKFVSKNLIALPFHEKDRIVFVPIKMGDEYKLLFSSNVDYWRLSWVAFDFDGNVSSHISKKDYLDYKENLDFDKLSESFGNVFIDFFELYYKGEEVRVIDRLNEMKIWIFS